MSAKIQPHSFEAERAVLANVLLRGADAVAALVSDGLSSPDFFHPANQLVFAAAVELDKAREPVTTVTVSGRLRSLGQMDRLEGGDIYLARLLDDIPSTEHVATYARMVIGSARLRRMSVALHDVQAEVPGVDILAVDEWMDRAEAQLFSANRESRKAQYEPIEPGIRAAAIEIAGRAQKRTPPPSPGVATGIADLDRKLGCLRGGNSYVLAARPGQGKTALALQLCGTARDQNVPTLFFSLEMPRRDLELRHLAQTSGVSLHMLLTGTPHSHDMVAITSAAKRLWEKRGIFCDDASGLSILEIRARARRFATDPGIKRTGVVPGLIVVDYIQLIKSSSVNKRNSTREQEVAEVSMGLKELSKELGMPVLALSQLNRGGANRTDPTPTLADLRSSGQIEQDADAVVFIHGDPPGEDEQDDDPPPKEVELILAKNRHGPPGRVKVMWEGRCVRFHGMANENQQDRGREPGEDDEAI